MIRDAGMNSQTAASLLCLPTVSAVPLVKFDSNNVNELLEKSFTQIRDRLRRPLQIDLYNYFCQRCFLGLTLLP